MSDHVLPGDMAEWPNDPCQLLGVSWGVSARDLRRAYLRLIKIYKPEHAPEQFRRIREAYETLSRFASHDSDSTSLEGPGAVVSHTTSFQSVPREVPPSPETAPALAPSDPWDLACQGDLEEAYQQLSNRVETAQAREEMFLQLYWLLLSTPALDAGRKPCDWLIRGIGNQGIRNRLLLATLGRELEANPHMAIDAVFSPLLSSATSPETLLSVIELRWRSVKSLEEWDVIEQDLQTLRSWVPIADEEVWTRLLIEAASNLVWARRKQSFLLKTIDKELKAFGRNTLDLSDPLFRLDCAREIDKKLRRFERFRGILATTSNSSGFFPLSLFRFDLNFNVLTLGLFWGKHKPIISTVRRILALTWDGSCPQSDALFRSHVARIANRPRNSLQTVQLLAQYAPFVFAQLRNALEESTLADRFEAEREESYDDTHLIEGFIRSRRWWRYDKFRLHLLDFCLREQISPHAVIEAIAERPRYSGSQGFDLPGTIAADHPLHFVYRACELSSV